MENPEYKPGYLETKVKKELRKNAKKVLEEYEKLNRRGRRLLTEETLANIEFARTILKDKSK